MHVLLAVASALVFVVPQLRIEPVPAVVGEPVSVTLRQAGIPVSGVAIEVELPGGEVAALGLTTPAGGVTFLPTVRGRHVFAATLGGVRSLAPCEVVPARARWPLAVGAVPLGLALLWWNVRRARDRRGP